ncbi:MAG: SDR family NAD(P)-dependent oxidoreductase [Candidatus Binatia bacterium]
MISDDQFRSRYGPWALVAGGSVGMGGEYSRQLARRGLNVVLIAETADPLEAFAASLAAEHGVETRSAVIDLSRPDVVAAVDHVTRDLEIGLLVYNAAHSVVGRFLEIPLADKLRTIDVNCRGPLLLAHHFAPRMVERRRGGIILVSSLAGFQGQAMVGTYAATKAFDLVLGEVLWEELRDHGVDVLAFCPGATRTPNFLATRPRAGGMLSAPLMDPAETVAEALAALGDGPTRIAGRQNRMAALVLHRLLPRRVLVRIMSRATRAMYE